MSTLLLVTGHLGSSLTHGPTYLVEFAPSPIQNFLACPPSKTPIESRWDHLTLQMYLMMGFHLFSMQNARVVTIKIKQRQIDLNRLRRFDEWRRKRYCTDPGSSTSSELYRRITLPGDHKEFMPKEGKNR
ncbi:MAG: hypothetical protein IPG82_11300 [Saprospiraceae bacterium]|nr:hypothetical protein [Saprospiraceae bacterium]